MLTQARLKAVLFYNPETGIFLWRHHRYNRLIAGTRAGSLHKSVGYRRIKFDGKEHREHRLAVLYMTGEFPPDQVDHINGTRTDNRWKNLRCVDRHQNHKNSKLLSTNKTGIPGVKIVNRKSRYHVSICDKGNQLNLGTFIDFFEACCARKSAEIQYNYHENHGR